MAQFLRICSVGILTLGLASASVHASPSGTSPSIRFVWKGEAGDKVLGDFSLKTLASKSHRHSKEKDPKGGEMVTWEGISFNWLLDHAIESLSVSDKASIDLIILIGKDGQRAILPRGLLSQVPMILALHRSGKDIGERGPVYSVLSWSTKSKALVDPLPLEKYFVSKVQEVELTNSKLFYGPFFMAKRSDPRAVRGERLFVQSCLACHDKGQRDKDFPLTLVSGVAHKPVSGLPKFEERDMASLKAYFKTFESEVAAMREAKK